MEYTRYICTSPLQIPVSSLIWNGLHTTWRNWVRISESTLWIWVVTKAAVTKLVWICTRSLSVTATTTITPQTTALWCHLITLPWQHHYLSRLKICIENGSVIMVRKRLNSSLFKNWFGCFDCSFIGYTVTWKWILSSLIMLSLNVFD